MKFSISLSIILLLLLLIFSFLYQASSSHGIAAGEDISSTTSYRSILAEQRRGRTGSRQIPDCGQMVSRSHCSQNPQCRWCRSDELDDMCFSKTEARRLPQQVFTCDS
ncbi:uncharacterized protein LOC120015395 [Tripterygium wilfordii]|uniref:uncharacterized protein LOC120015395 n=1 Tax=Tripterygium wilfordii TaxID=458696 RepID=UPI0018F86045|nr:uncharacterized protein LOC120015395 [Tripterygium wilfordii]